MGQEVEDLPKPRAEKRHFRVSVWAMRLVSCTPALPSKTMDDTLPSRQHQAARTR